MFIRDFIEEAYNDHAGATVLKYDLDKAAFDGETFKMALAANKPVVLHNYPYAKREQFKGDYGIDLDCFVVTGAVQPMDYSEDRKRFVALELLGPGGIKPGTVTHVKSQGEGSEGYSDKVKTAATGLKDIFGS